MHERGGVLVGGPYDGEVLLFDWDAVIRVHCPTIDRQRVLEWHTYERDRRLVLDGSPPCDLFFYVESETAGDLPLPKADLWNTRGSDYWSMCARGGHRPVVLEYEPAPGKGDD